MILSLVIKQIHAHGYQIPKYRCRFLSLLGFKKAELSFSKRFLEFKVNIWVEQLSFNWNPLLRHIDECHKTSTDAAQDTIEVPSNPDKRLETVIYFLTEEGEEAMLVTDDQGRHSELWHWKTNGQEYSNLWLQWHISDDLNCSRT